MRRLLLFVCAAVATLCSCSYTNAPEAGRADVFARYAAPPPSVHEPPAEPGLPPEVAVHTAETEEIEDLQRIARDLGEDPEVVLREGADAYLLSPGDKVVIEVPGAKDLGGEAVIAPDGTVALKGAGATRIAGLSIERAQAALEERLSRLLKRPQVLVSLKEPAKRSVTLSGDLEKPQRIDLIGTETILDVLTSAGLGAESLRGGRLSIVRGARKATIDLANLVELRHAGYNLKVRPNDILLLHRRAPVTVGGEVARAGAYSVPSRGYLTLREALGLAGWHTDKADLQRVVVTRKGGNCEVVDVNGELYDAPRAQPLLLYPGDQIHFPVSRETGVYVFGMVQSPGLKRRSGGMSVLQALALADYERFGAVLDQAVVVRDWRSDPKVLAVDISRLLKEGDLSQNLALNDGDVLYIPQSNLSASIQAISEILRPIAQGAATEAAIIEAETARQRLKGDLSGGRK